MAIQIRALRFWQIALCSAATLFLANCDRSASSMRASTPLDPPGAVDAGRDTGSAAQASMNGGATGDAPHAADGGAAGARDAGAAGASGGRAGAGGAAAAGTSGSSSAAGAAAAGTG